MGKQRTKEIDLSVFDEAVSPKEIDLSGFDNEVKKKPSPQQSPTTGESSVIGSDNPLNPSRVRMPNNFNFAQQEDPETYNKVQAEKQQAKQKQSQRLSEINKTYDAAQGEGTSQSIRAGLDEVARNSITPTESTVNSVKNMANRLKGTIPRLNIVAADTWENVLGKELTKKWYEFEGRDIDQVRNQAYADLAELQKEVLPTLSLTTSIQDGSIKNISAGMANAITSLGSSAIPAIATGGAGIFTEMTGDALVDFNEAKAKRLGISVPELYKQDKAEFGIPATIGALGGSLELIGLKGATNLISKKITGSAMKKAAIFFTEANKEGLTEFLQTGLEQANRSLGAGESLEQATKSAVNKMFSKEGLESYLQGIAGSAGAGGLAQISRAITSPTAKTSFNDEIAKVNMLEMDLRNPAIDDAAKVIISDEANRSISNMADIIEEDIKNDNELNPKQRVAITDINNKIHELQAVVEDPNVSQNTKDVIQSQIDDLNKQAEAIKPNNETTTENTVTPIKKGTDVQIDDTIELVDGKRGKITSIEGNNIVIDLESGGTLSANPSFVEMMLVNPKNNNDGIGTPVISEVEDGDLYEFRTDDGIVAGVLTSPTTFRIDGISANEVGSGKGSKMFENLISFLKNKGVTTITTESAGEGAVLMHDKAVEKGLLTEVSKDGRSATYTINSETNVTPKESTTENENTNKAELEDYIAQATEVAEQHEALAEQETDPIEKQEQLDIAKNAREVIEKSNEELTSIRGEEVIAKAEKDLSALKQVTDKVKKYEASMKRLTEAKNNKEISITEFNDLKKRFDDVIGESTPKVKEETTDAVRQQKTEEVPMEPETGVSEKVGRGNEIKETTTSTKEKVTSIQEKRQSIKDRISQKLKEQRGNLSSGFDPSLLSDFVELGSTYIEEGVVKASDFIKRFREDYKDMGFDDKDLTDEDITNEIYNKVQSTEATEKESLETYIQEIGLTKDDVANLRTTLGAEQYTYDIKESSERVREAKQAIKDGYNIKALIKKFQDGDNLPTDLEVEIVKQYYASLTTAISKNPTPELIKQRDDLLKAIDVVKTQQGRAVQAWDGLTTLEDNLANFLTQESQFTTLTQEEINELTSKYNKAKEALEAYQKKQQAAATKAKNKKAQENINKAKSSPNKAKVKEAFREERKKFVEDFRAELRKIRTTPSAIILPYQRELIALAPFVRKMVQSYASEGIYDLKQIVKGIHEEFTQDIPELTEDDVRDIIAGEYTDTRKTRNAKMAQIHDLQRQAKLEREIALLEQGIVETRNPVQKRKKSDKIIALEAEIKEIKKRNPELFAPQIIAEAEKTAQKNIAELEKKLADDDLSFKEIDRPTSTQLEEFRKRQKELRTELEARRKEAEIGRYSEEAKLDSRKRWFTNQIDKLKKDISDGNYETIEEPVPVLLDQEALKLKDEYMKFREETRRRRDKLEYDALSKYDKAIDKFRQVLELRRLVQTSIDLSIPLRQGISVMMNTGIPFVNEGTTNIGIDAYQKMLSAVRSKDNYNRLMFDIEHSPEYLESKDDGIVYAEIGSTSNENRDEYHRQSFLYDIPYLRAPFMASERAASAWQNYARYQLYLRGVKMLEAQGKTRGNAKQAYEQMAARVMVDTGRGKIPGVSDKTSSAEGKLAKQLLGNTLYGARLASAIFRKLNPLYFFGLPIDKKGTRVDRSVRVQALKDMAGYTTGLLITGLAFAAMGYAVSFDYDDPDFLKARKGKKVIDFTGGQSTYVRTYLRLLTAVYKRADPDISYEDSKNYSKFATNSFFTFFRNKLAPNTSYGVNMWSGENTIGEKFDPWEIMKIYPMYGDDVFKSVKEGNPLDLLTIIPVSISGLGYMEYDKDVRRANLNTHLDSSKDKKVISFLKSHQLNLKGDINQEVYDINTGGKTRLTAKQSDEYEKIWADYIKESLNEPGEIASLSKLKEKDFKKEINKIKLEATKYAKSKVTGLAEGITTIRDDEKTYELTPEQVKQRIKLNKEFIEENGADMKDGLVESYMEEGMSKNKAEKQADLAIQRKANTYSKNVMVGEEKDKNDGKITFKEKE